MPDKAHLLQTEQQTLKFRLLALLVIAFGLYVQRAELAPLPVGLLVALYLAYAALLRYYVLPRLPERYAHPTAYAMAVVDVGAAAGALAFFQLQSPAFILFPIVIIYYAILLGYNGSLVTATLLSLAYLGLAYLKGMTRDLGSLMAYQVPFLYLIALFTGYLARERFRERETRLALEQLMRVERGTREVLELTHGLQKGLDLETVLPNMARQAVNLVGADQALVLLAEAGRLAIRASVSEIPHAGPEAAAGVALDQLDEGPARQAFAARSPTLAQGVRLRGQAVPSLLAVPLLSGEREMGAIYLWHADPGKTFGPGQVAQARVLGELASLTLGHALALAQAETRSARLASELRSSLQGMKRARLAPKAPLALGELSLDPAREEARLGDKKLPLTATEFQVLYLLAQNAGTPLGDERLLHEVWGDDFQGQSNVVDVTVHRLRRKLGPRGQRLIRTVRGAGYMVAKP